jgi:hypothetical protein
VDFSWRGAVSLAWPVATMPGRQARSAMDGGLCAFAFASPGQGATWLRIYPRNETETDPAADETLDAVNEDR